MRTHAKYHPAVHAWRHVRSEPFEPAAVEILKKGKKTGVYRLLGDNGGGPRIVAKHCRVRSGFVERAVYEDLLPGLPLPSVRLHGFLQEDEGDLCWIFLDDAGSIEYSPTQPEHRALAARFAAAVHRTAISPRLRALLPDRAPEHYLARLRSNRSALLRCMRSPDLTQRDRAVLRSLAEELDLVESRWSEIEAHGLARTRGVMHGDFVIKNLRIQDRPGGPALLVYDWEMAGLGCPATDLAQFVGRCASPDLDVYGSALFGGSGFDARELRRLAHYGSVLRVLDKVSWSIESMVDDSYIYMLGPLHCLARYEPQLAETLRALDWMGHD